MRGNTLDARRLGALPSPVWRRAAVPNSGEVARCGGFRLRNEPFRPDSQEFGTPARRYASRRIRAVTRVPKYSASTGTHSSAVWNCPNTSKSAGKRSGTKP